MCRKNPGVVSFFQNVSDISNFVFNSYNCISDLFKNSNQIVVENLQYSPISLTPHFDF